MALPNNLVSTFTTKVGIATVQIRLFNPLEPDDQFDIYDIGDIEYDFDVTSYGDVINNLGANYSRSRFVCGLYSKANRDIFDIMYNQLFLGISTVPVTLTINTYDGQTYVFSYEIRPNGLKYDENSLKLTIDLDPPLLSTDTVTSVSTSVTPKTLVGTTLGTSVSGIMVGQFIKTVVDNFNTSLPTIYEPAETTPTFAGLTYAIPVFGFTPTGINLYMNPTTASGLAIDEVARFAVLGGDLYGTGFGYNFYVNRNRTNMVAQVNYDEVESLQFSFSPSPYRSIALTMDGTPPSNVLDTTATALGNQFAEKTISGFYSLPSYVVKANFGGAFADTDYSGYLSRDIETVITASGINAHKNALNAQPSPLIRVEVSVFGFDKVKPYEVVQFTGEVPDKYKFTTGANPRYFRPTTISYNLMDDKVKLKMYSIN